MRERRAMAEPNEAALREAALRYLARYASTEARLTQILKRRASKWEHFARGQAIEAARIEAVMAAARAAIAAIVAQAVANGTVNDQGFAEMRGRSLARAGRSARAAAAHLSARGVPGTIIEGAVARDGDTELAAALIHARKRRLGPFAPPPRPDADAARLRARAMASFARAGFAGAIAARVLRMPRDEAEARIIAFRHALDSTP